MKIPALITAGDHDQSPLSVRGPDWWTDGYTLSPGEKSLLTVFGAEHSQGGIHAYSGIPETAAESPALLALVQNHHGIPAQRRRRGEADWPVAHDALAQDADPAGRPQSKRAGR